MSGPGLGETEGRDPIAGREPMSLCAQRWESSGSAKICQALTMCKDLHLSSVAIQISFDSLVFNPNHTGKVILENIISV